MRRALAILAVLAAVAVPSASGVESTIYPGVGIGRVRLGMTKSQVERVLGRAQLVNARQGAYTEYAWDFATWTVGFQGGRAVQVSTTLRSQRTIKRIGVGSTWRGVVHAYPGGRCSTAVIFGGNGHPVDEYPEYLVGRKGGTQTIWKFRDKVPAVVDEVFVRTPFRRLPEFAPGWDYQCADGWETAAHPGVKIG